MGDLAALAERAADDPVFGHAPPISRQRAASLAANPHGDPADPALLLAYTDGRCVGYHGLLPGLLAGPAGRSRILWLITFFVAPGWRGRGVGRALVAAAQSLGADLVTTGITAGAERIYRACGLRGLGELAYWQWRGDDLPRAARWFLHAAARLALGASPPAAGRRPPPGFFGAGAPRLYAGAPDQPRFHRDRQTADWMIARPWVASRAAAPPEVPRYHFSAVRERFAFVPMAAGPGDFLLSASRHRGRAQVKVLDLFFDPPAEGLAAVLPAAVALGRRFGAARIDFPAGLLDPAALPGWYRRRIRRRRRLTLYHPARPDGPLAAAADRILLDYCDSDTAFT